MDQEVGLNFENQGMKLNSAEDALSEANGLFTLAGNNASRVRGKAERRHADLCADAHRQNHHP